MNQSAKDMNSYRGSWPDCSDDCYRVYFEIGGGPKYALPIIEKFLADWVMAMKTVSPAYGDNIAVRESLNGVEVDVPMQKIPEIVIALAAENVAVFQVVRITKLI